MGEAVEVGKRFSLGMRRRDTVGTSGHGCEFRTLGNASIRSSSNAEAK